MRSSDTFAKNAYLPKSKLKRGKSAANIKPADPRLTTWSKNFYKSRDKFTTPNDNSDTVKAEFGYIHDNTYINASDPNSMVDMPGVPRSF